MLEAVIGAWALLSLLTAILMWSAWGRPYPLYKALHLLWMWPLVALTFAAVVLLDLDTENPLDVTRD